MNNINFQGRSNLILNPDAYDKARVATSNAYRHLSSKNNCKLTNGKVFTSKADAQNLAVIVRNEKDRKSTRLNSSHNVASRMPSSA